MNAKDELLSALSNNNMLPSNIAWAKILYKDNLEDNFCTTIFKSVTLQNYHTDKEREEFFDKISKFEYDRGLGSQYLFGVVMLKSGQWFERRSYDGAEWWQLCTVPKISDEFIDYSNEFHEIEIHEI